MMKSGLNEFLERIKTVKLPYTYRFFREKTELPYLCYQFTGSNNFMADGIVYQKINRIRLELYTEIKDLDLEDKVEEAISLYPWQKTENYIDSEKCYQIIYEIEV